MTLPDDLAYPIIAVSDLHGRRRDLERLVERLERLPEWPDAALAFLGDYVDRGPDTRGTIDLVLELLRRPAGGSAVMGNHDLGLIRTAQLDDGPPSPYWRGHFPPLYSGGATLASYLGRPNRGVIPTADDLGALREVMPRAHREFLAGLRWVVEAPGHLFLHCGLSPELGADPAEQVAALRARRWERAEMRPRPRSNTDRYWQPEYPVWIGADRKLSRSPLPFPGKVQVTGHDTVDRPEADAVRIRLDTGGGVGPPSACLLRSADAPPEFITVRPL
jgi:serine/threonine protein phosphatase 1